MQDVSTAAVLLASADAAAVALSLGRIFLPSAAARAKGAATDRNRPQVSERSRPRASEQAREGTIRWPT